MNEQKRPKCGRTVLFGAVVAAALLGGQPGAGAADFELSPPRPAGHLRGPELPGSGAFRLDFDGASDPYSLGLIRNGNPTAQVRNGAACTPLSRTLDRIPNRTELVPVTLPRDLFPDGKAALIGKSYWYALDVYLPPGMQPDSDNGESLIQWHDVHDPGEASKNPALALMLYRDDYVLAVRGDAKPFTPAKGRPRYTRNNSYNLGSFLPDRGQWVRWTFHVRWAFDDSAFLTVWKNDQIVHEERGLATAFNDHKGPIFKFGVYKWGWPRASAVDQRLVCFRRLRISGSAAR